MAEHPSASAPLSPPLGPDEQARYARQLMLREVGVQGQKRLRAARVVLVGMGGLGCPAAQYLAGAGVGHLRLVDPDTVAVSNLHRQPLYTSADIGTPKVAAAAGALTALNPHVSVEAVAERLTSDTAERLLAGADVVLDGCDDFFTRFAVNAATRRLAVPLVSGALGRWTGQLSVFNATSASPCYRCLVPVVPPEAELCETVGVIGALAGVIGTWMALEALKLITRAGEPLDGRLMVFDGLSGATRTLDLPRDPGCATCGGA